MGGERVQERDRAVEAGREGEGTGSEERLPFCSLS